ncbi:MAG: hypothetical protein EA397_15330 [Deltaproteobacteria bacterium]|nr:MAG: hypothetical protein EA397_15330 [Deltaproteobacteria bacterium]
MAILVLVSPALATEGEGWVPFDEHDDGIPTDPHDEDEDDEDDEDDGDHFDGPFVSGQTAADLADEEGGTDCSGMDVGAAAVVALPLLALGRRRL